MARLWSFAAGLNTLTAGVEFTSGNGSGAIAISAFPADATRRALRFNPSAASAWMGQIAKASASSGQFWVGQAIEVGTAPASATEFVGLWNSGAGTRHAGCYIDNSHVVHLRDSTANNRVSSSALSAGIHFVEFTTTVSAGSAAMELVIDGVSIGTFASGTVGDFDAVYWGTPAGAGTYDLYLSEFAINDSSGSNETSWPSGKNAGVATGRRYAYAWPSAAGDGQQWNKQGGGAASSTNYQDVDETTPDDATTYLRRTTTGAKVDDYNLPSAASLGIGASDTIRLIQVGARVGSTSTTATGRNYATRIKSQASGTVTTGATAACNVNGWTTHVAAAPKNYQLTSYVDPQAGGAWTPSLIDNAQIGITTVTSSTNEIRVSTVWALIEYVVNATTSIAPSPVAVPLAIPAPAVSLTLALAPDPVAVPLALPSPTITLGALTITPDPAAVPLVVPAPVVALSYDLTPAPVTVPLALPPPTVSLILSLAPAPVAVPLALPAPTVSLGDLGIVPDPVAVPLVIPVPTVTQSGATQTITPDPVAVPLVVPAPAVMLGALAVAPDPVTAALVVPAPAVALSYDLAPDPVAVPLALPPPTVSLGALTISPSPVAIPIALPAPTVTKTLALAPTLVAIPIAIPAPTVTQGGDITLTPAPVAVVLSVPTPTVTVPTPVVPVVAAGGVAGWSTRPHAWDRPPLPPLTRVLSPEPLAIRVDALKPSISHDFTPVILQDDEELMLAGVL